MVTDLEHELDTALARLVEVEDELDNLKRDNAELSDALGAMIRAHQGDLLAELGALRRRNGQLETELRRRRDEELA